MCLAFVVGDIGNPLVAWHLFPGIGVLNWPSSLLAWDVIVLNGYLALNLGIPAYILYSHYTGREPLKKACIPFIYISVFWAVSIHMVTAFLLAGPPARPFGNSALLGPRFLASGLDGHNALVPWVWTALLFNVLATAILTIHRSAATCVGSCPPSWSSSWPSGSRREWA